VNAESGGRFVTFSCDCGQAIRVPVERVGSEGRCKACGRRIVVPGPVRRDAPAEPPGHYVSPHHRRDLEGTYSEEDLVTYPDTPPIREKSDAPEKFPEQKKSLFEMLGEILRYPVATKLATQIFVSGAVLFSPLIGKAMIIGKLLPCCLGVPIMITIFIIITSIRLMYVSFLLLIIETSAQGSGRIPELPVFQSWQDNLQDLLKVLGASVIAFAPYLVYAMSLNIEMISRLLEAYSRGEAPGEEVFGAASANLGMLVLIYAIIALYMPMVLMTLVVTKSFGKAVNPAFIFRSIFRIRREYLVAMVIIFLFLRGSLTVLTILKDVLGYDWFAIFVGYVGEPIFEFYAVVVTMHVIGLLYYRNAKKLQW